MCFFAKGLRLFHLFANLMEALLTGRGRGSGGTLAGRSHKSVTQISLIDQPNTEILYLCHHYSEETADKSDGLKWCWLAPAKSC